MAIKFEARFLIKFYTSFTINNSLVLVIIRRICRLILSSGKQECNFKIVLTADQGAWGLAKMTIVHRL